MAIAMSPQLTGVAASEHGGAQLSRLEALQALDQQVADVAWRLLTVGPELCPIRRPALGINLHHATQYQPNLRGEAVATFGLAPSHPSILTVAERSPAKFAGIKANDVLLTVNGKPLVVHEGGRGGGDRAAQYEQVDAAMRVLEELPEGMPANLTVARGGKTFDIAVQPQMACRSRVELAAGPSVNGSANGEVAQIYGGLAAWTQGDDELALAIAHEIAHNALGHADELKRLGIKPGRTGLFGSGNRRMREMEREADRLGTQMVAAAGFDYTIAPDFWERLARKSGFAALLARTHPTAANRRRNLEDTVREIAKQREGSSAVPAGPQK